MKQWEKLWHVNTNQKKVIGGTYLGVQCLDSMLPAQGAQGSIPGRGTQNLHAMWCEQKKQESKVIGVAMLILNKVQSKAYYQLLRRLFHNETEVNVYSYNNEASKYMKQDLIEMKGETERFP